MNRRWSWIAAIVLMIGLCATAAHACPMCKESVPSSDAQQASGVPSGLNNSIYFILIGFLTVLGSTVGFLTKAIRDTSRVRAAGFPVIDPRSQRPNDQRPNDSQNS